MRVERAGYFRAGNWGYLTPPRTSPRTSSQSDHFVLVPHKCGDSMPSLLGRPRCPLAALRSSPDDLYLLDDDLKGVAVIAGRHGAEADRSKRKAMQPLDLIIHLSIEYQSKRSPFGGRCGRYRDRPSPQSGSQIKLYSFWGKRVGLQNNRTKGRNFCTI